MTANLDILIQTLEKLEGIDPLSTDIFGLDYGKDMYEVNPNKRFIKIIPLENTISFNDYNKKEYFTLVAEVIMDDEIHTSGKKEGKKKRQTCIKFESIIPIGDFKEDGEWVYLFTINGQIVKIGGTRAGLHGRTTSSYLCGHHIKERGKSGDCSKTNGYIYNTFEHYLHLGGKIQMYGCKIPKAYVESTLFGKTNIVPSYTYNHWEADAIEDFKRDYHFLPFLSDNCDPRSRNAEKKTRKPREKKERKPREIKERKPREKKEKI